jgi:hypothetical protein
MVFHNQFYYASLLVVRISGDFGGPEVGEPYLHLSGVTANMDVWRLVPFFRVEEEHIRAEMRSTTGMAVMSHKI